MLITSILLRKKLFFCFLQIEFHKGKEPLIFSYKLLRMQYLKKTLRILYSLYEISFNIIKAYSENVSDLFY